MGVIGSSAVGGALPEAWGSDNCTAAPPVRNSNARQIHLHWRQDGELPETEGWVAVRSPAASSTREMLAIDLSSSGHRLRVT